MGLTFEPKPSGSGGMRPLGMFRLFLAFLVMLQHIGINLVPPNIAYYSAVWQPGTVGVVTFLFLSAFIILDVAVSTYNGHPVRFIANRALRILPEFVIALLIAIAVQYYLFRHGNPANFYFYPTTEDAFGARNIFFNFIALVPTPTSPMSWDFVYTIWTVRYEIVFYITVFAILAVTNRVSPVFRVGLVERGVLCGSISVTAFTLLAPLEGTYEFMAALYSFIAMGAIYYVLRENTTLGKQPDALVYGIVIGVMTYLLLDYTNSMLATAMTLVAVVVAIGLLELRIVNKKLARVDHICGDLSYTVFLLHLQVATLVKNFMGASLSSFAVAMLMSFAVSLIISVGVRKITSPLRTRIRGRALLG